MLPQLDHFNIIDNLQLDSYKLTTVSNLSTQKLPSCKEMVDHAELTGWKSCQIKDDGQEMAVMVG